MKNCCLQICRSSFQTYEVCSSLAIESFLELKFGLMV